MMPAMRLGCVDRMGYGTEVIYVEPKIDHLCGPNENGSIQMTTLPANDLLAESLKG